jgi:hypothetical protein
MLIPEAQRATGRLHQSGECRHHGAVGVALGPLGSGPVRMDTRLYQSSQPKEPLMSTTASHSGASPASRMVVTLTVAGWLTILALTLPAGMSSDAGQSPTMDIQRTPVKAYPG